MTNFELVKQRRDLKRSLKVANNSTSAEIDNTLTKNELAKKRTNKLKQGLKKSKKKQRFKQGQLKNSDSNPPWYSGRYNQLDEVVVNGIDKSLLSKLNTSLVEEDRWWKKSIDLSFKNPWPEARWDWFENNANGEKVYGTGGGSLEFGNRIGKNSKVYGSQYMDEWIIPGGGGGKLNFYKNLNNYTKYGILGIKTVSEAYDHGNKLNKVLIDYKKLQKNDSISVVKMKLITHLDIKANLTKSLDSLKFKIPLNRSVIDNEKLKDSVEIHNDNQRNSAKYWLNQ
ncbi:hypothetical protein KO500_13555 [Cellulophaga baltica]|uniref:hypothetical protein n=1 Tax=Cellulophaga TaxID=104264 RepID=UPI001C06C55B|nr:MULTISPECIES: hypothetical protein [Cellulophaga]MBU2997469.1 hypothetical protein [Cellulophaga baltica]MDO6768866.1 hypothetical protein [Cellulophaga sp. 1_MG-2023]